MVPCELEYTEKVFYPDNVDLSGSFVNDGTTAIELAAFEGSAMGGKVTLDWKTATEVDNAGFNLYRATSEDGVKTQLNGSLLAASAAGASGASYSFVDRPGDGVFYYWLEDVDLTGRTTLHGPVRVSVKPLFQMPVRRPSLPGVK